MKDHAHMNRMDNAPLDFLGQSHTIQAYFFSCENMEASTQVTIAIFVINLIVSALVSLAVAFFRIGAYKNKVDNLETTVGKDEHSGLRKTVGDMKDKVVACETRLKEREPLGKRRSPLALSERGVNFLKASGAEKFVDDNYAELRDLVDAKEPKTSYDVQEEAKEAIKTLKEDPRLNPLKEWLFKDGSTLEDLFFVMSIHLRDKILREKGWNVEDIDNHTSGV